MFGDPTLGDQLDLFSLGSLYVPTAGVGSVNLWELSLDLPEDLDELQADAFTLVTVTFDTLAAGVSTLGLVVNYLGDSVGDSLATTVEGGSITVNRQASVPEPFTAALLSLGLVGLGLTRRFARR